VVSKQEIQATNRKAQAYIQSNIMPSYLVTGPKPQPVC